MKFNLVGHAGMHRGKAQMPVGVQVSQHDSTAHVPGCLTPERKVR